MPLPSPVGKTAACGLSLGVRGFSNPMVALRGIEAWDGSAGAALDAIPNVTHTNTESLDMYISFSKPLTFKQCGANCVAHTPKSIPSRTGHKATVTQTIRRINEASGRSGGI